MTRVVAAPYVFLGAGPSPLPSPRPRPRASPEASWVADGAIAFDGDVVLAAGPRAEIEARFGPGERVDAALLPALVNAHTHLELSHLAGRIPGGRGLASWVRLLVAARAGAMDPGPALYDAIARLEESGVAAVGEVTNTLAALPKLRAAGIAGTVFLEVFGFTPARIEAALGRARRLMAAADAGPALAVHLTPHAVYSTAPEVVARLLAAGPASIHLAEDPSERAFCAEAAGPFAELNRLLAMGEPPLAPFARSPVAAVAPSLRRDALCVHLVDVDEQDISLLAGSGATGVLCPRSNLHIGGRLPDVPRLLAAGVPLAIGTDSLASSPSLSPLAELAALAVAFPAVGARRLLPLAWNGAAVGAPAVGRIAPGAAPGVVAAALAGARPADPARWLLEEFGAADRPLAWIARHRPEASG